MTFTTSVLTPMQPREVRIIVGCTIVNLALAALLLVAAGTDVAGTEFALRMTARISFVYFVLVFVASPLERLGAGRIGSWLSSRRRAVGVVFGISMSIHVAFIVRLFTLHWPARPPMVTSTDFSIGIPGLVLVALMTATSFHVAHRWIGAIAWQRLHSVGIYTVWAIFFLCLVDSVSRKSSQHPLLEYYSFIGVLVGAMLLRAAAARVERRQ